jgi:hypothetical protein
MDMVVGLTKSDNEKSRKLAKLLINPKNGLELRLAKSQLAFYDDAIKLIEALICDNVKIVPMEENEVVNIITDYIGNIKDRKEVNDKDVFEKFNNLNHPEKLAGLYFNLITGVLGNIDGVCDYMSEKLELDMDDPIDNVIFNSCFKEAQKKIESLDLTKKSPIENITEDSVKSMEVFVESFHELCDKNIKTDEDSIGEILELLMKMSRDR